MAQTLPQSPLLEPSRRNSGSTLPTDNFLRRKCSDQERLIEHVKNKGYYAEFMEHRTGYQKWRRGESRGAKGEFTETALEEKAKVKESAFEYWYPTVQIFKFRRVLSFWLNVLLSGGCLMFLWVPFYSECLAKELNGLSYYLTKIPTLIGGTMFIVAIYFALFELLNMDTDVGQKGSRLNYLWCDWHNLINKMQISISSILACWLYMIGACLYTVAQISDLFNLAGTLHSNLIEWPLILGGFLFFLAGVCELVINEVHLLEMSRVWWVAVMNFQGGLCFWLSAVPCVFVGTVAECVGVYGTTCYLIATVLQLWMWRGEQFGGALLPRLNDGERSGTEDASNLMVRYDKDTQLYHIISNKPASKLAPMNESSAGSDKKVADVLGPKLSWRGLLFLHLYVVTVCFCLLSCCVCLHHAAAIRARGVSETERPKLEQIMNTFVYSLLNVVIVFMLLIMKSANASMPKKGEEPYRTLMFMTRIISIVILANSLLTLKLLVDTPGP